VGSYCEPCPLNGNRIVLPPPAMDYRGERPAVSVQRREKDDSIVLL
jgi:hypothetical protein